ncbi:MAG TPA: radical SAM protein [Actinobacteria bacterium]|nr:radical SAM protein [Actinomycetes bacterium]HEX21240.1 radical SAM protein [Actinomycetota bacterium]
MKEEFVPKWIAWETTGRCNLNCVHCRCDASMEAGAGDFNTEEGKALLDDIASYAKPVIVLSGGEPLLRKDLFELARHGTDLGLRMCIATNGTLINDKICEQMKAAEIKMVSLSLDGSTAEIHDDFRHQQGAFAGTLRGMEFLKKHNIPFLINSSFTKRNQEDIPNVYRLAKKLGATAWYMFMIVPTGRGEEIMSELISAEDYEEILDWHFHQEIEEEAMLMRPTCAPHYYRITLQRQKAEGLDYERRNLTFSTGGSKGCIAAQVIALITQHGDVQPCSYFPKSAGNVKEKSFKEIWENSPLFAELRDFSKYKGRCGACEYINVCGGCRARADAVYGDYLAEEPFCNYVPFKMKKSIKGSV